MHILKNIKTVMILGLVASYGTLSTAADSKPIEKPDVIAILAPELNRPGISQDQQDDGQIVLSRKIQISLRKAFGCKSGINPVSLYRKHPSNSFEFYYTSDECKIRPKEGALCEAGFAAKNPPKDIGMDDYKICVKTTSEKNHPPTDPSGTR
jgi:hypothetical protein